jgi:cobalt/nickel transport system permease protein
MTQLPNWLAQSGTGPLPAVRSRWGRADYLEKTLADIQRIMAEDMYQAGIAARPGLLQTVEPRVKVVGLFLLLLAVALTRSLPVLAVVHLMVFLAACLSGIGGRDYLLRTWLPASIFAGLVVLPATLSWITPGQPLFIIFKGANWHAGTVALPADLFITVQGVKAAAMVTLRAATSLGVVALLVKTTRWPVLTKALQSLGMPGLFVMVLDLTYRYLFLFLLLVADFLLGRRSRLVGLETAGAKLAWIGGTLAGFLRLAGEYSREIAAAMQARGYDGENRLALEGRVGFRDAGFLLIVLLIAFSLWGGI